MAQQGLHLKSFEFMRLSPEVEGLISNFHQVLDGYLAGGSTRALLPEVQKVSGPADAPVMATTRLTTARSRCPSGRRPRSPAARQGGA
mgnify:CR=1 FL=1